MANGKVVKPASSSTKKSNIKIKPPSPSPSPSSSDEDLSEGEQSVDREESDGEEDERVGKEAKTSVAQEEEEVDDEEEEESDGEDGEVATKKAKKSTEDDKDDEDDKEENEKNPKKVRRPLDKLLKKHNRDSSSSSSSKKKPETTPGVLYVARIPPKCTVSKIKTLLSVFGEILKIYLAEEDKSKAKRRKRAGGGGGKRYTEGWVEYADKRIAKRVGVMLNMTNMESRKRANCKDDLWNLKYLKGFKWSHLTEKVAYERRVREQKLKIEMNAAKRENREFERMVEEGEKFEKMVERKAKKGGGEEKSGEGAFKRKFKQAKPIVQEEYGNSFF